MSEPVDRRTLLAGGALALTAAGCGQGGAGSQENAENSPSAPAVARRRREFRMVTTWPPNFPGLGDMATRLAQKVDELSEGAMSIRVYSAGELVGAFEAFDAVASGSADMYHGAEYYWQGRSPGFNFFTAVPMGFTPWELGAWLDHGGGQELWEELSGEFGVIGIACGNSGPQMGGWFTREINSLEDFRGLTMRIPGLGGEIMRGLNAAAVAIPGSEIFPSLQSGAIDATEWVGPWNDLAFGFHQVADYYYGPGFHEPGSALALGVNRGVWDGLTAEEQNIIRIACRWVTDYSINEFAYENARALQTLESEHGVQLRQYPDDVWARVAELSRDVVAAQADADPITRRIYDSYMEARRMLLAWAPYSEGGYLAARAAHDIS